MFLGGAGSKVIQSMVKNKALSGLGKKLSESATSRAAAYIIAQEVEEIYPNLVVTDDDWMKAVKYGNVVAILIEWLKELFNKVIWNTKEISDLENELEKLKDEMKEIKRMIKK